MYEAIVMGASSGGLNVFSLLFPELNKDFPWPIVIVHHIGVDPQPYTLEYLNSLSNIPVKEAEQGEPLARGNIYFASSNYHLLIEPDKTFSFSVDEKVHHCRPAIDPLFQSAADAYGASLIGVVLSGANSDGAAGLKSIKARGGITIVQEPQTAECDYMPWAAIHATSVDYVISVDKLVPLWLSFLQGGTHDSK